MERSAHEILLAQCEYEVLEAKQALAREYFTGKAYDCIADLAEKVVIRWWVGRAGKRDKRIEDPAALKARQDKRGMLLHECMRVIVERSGKIEPEALQVAQLALSSDINALWGLIIEAGLCSPAMRQDYLDSSIANTHARVVEHAQKIILAGAPTGRAS